jgi:hypothetical protein
MVLRGAIMNEQKDEKWLDELISKSIDTSEPRFDAEQWKQKYPGEFQALVEREARRPQAARFDVLSVVMRSRIAQVAAAAVFIIAVGLFIAHLDHRGQQRGQPEQLAKSPAEMVTSASLRTAYNRGGMEALEEQCDRAARMLGQGLLSMKDVVEESNG